MEVFSLFKHRRVSGGRAPPPSTIATSALRPSTDTDDDVFGDDEGPFFDLEFALPDEEAVSGSDAEDDDLTACSDRIRAAWSEPSTSGDLFFRHPTSLFATSEPWSKPTPSSQPKPSAKLRVLMIGFRKRKETAAAPPAAAGGGPESRKQRRRSKFSLRLKVEEVPMALFTKTEKPQRRASKDALQRYLSKIKPLYVRVSRRYGEKLGSPDGAPPAAAEATQRVHYSGGSNNLQSGFRVVCRRLGKSRSASAAVRSALARRRDDTLLELQDGIQNAILHCKRSFNEGSRGTAESLQQPLLRSRSDPGEAAAAAAASKG